MDQQLLLNLTIVVSASTAIMTFVDILLSSKQKKWLNNCAELLWIWLDDQRAGRFLSFYLHRKVQNIQTFAVVIFYFSFLIYYLFVEGNEGLLNYEIIMYGYSLVNPLPASIWPLVFVFLTIVPIFYFHSKLLKDLSRQKSIWRYLFTSTLYCAFMVAMAANVIFFGATKFDFSWDIAAAAKEGQGLGFGLFIISICCFLNWLLVEFALLLLTSGIGWLWVLLVLTISGLLWVLQFATLKISENPKGPILAISSFLAALGALIKFFVEKV